MVCWAYRLHNDIMNRIKIEPDIFLIEKIDQEEIEHIYGVFRIHLLDLLEKKMMVTFDMSERRQDLIDSVKDEINFHEKLVSKINIENLGVKNSPST